MWRPRARNFAVSVGGRDVFSYRLESFDVDASPEFVAREAARFVMMPWRRFRMLPGYEQAEIIAYYETVQQLEAVLAMKRAEAARS